MWYFAYINYIQWQLSCVTNTDVSGYSYKAVGGAAAGTEWRSWSGPHKEAAPQKWQPQATGEGTPPVIMYEWIM